MEDLLKFDGRIRRMGWWIAGIGMGIVGSVFEWIRDADNSIILTLVFGILALVVWVIGISLSVRRFHDLNQSGWLVLINIIPLVGWLITLIMLGFMPGDQGENKYGPPPREGSILG